MLGWFGDKKASNSDRSSSPEKEEKFRRSPTPESAKWKSHLHETGTAPSQPKYPSTPHDDILAELHGQEEDLGEVDGVLIPNRGTSEGGDETFQNPRGPQPQSRRSSSALAEKYSNREAKDSSTIPETLHDPFSGAQLGVVMPEPSPPLDDPDIANNDQELWTHLGRILDLQSQIALKHVEMEAIGSRTKTKTKRTPDNLDGDRLRKTRRHWERFDRVDGEIVNRLGDIDDGDEGLEADEEAERKKAREDAFAKLDDMFTGRKEAIDDIMTNLNDLSKALTTFHALQTPTLDLSSNSPKPTINRSRPRPPKSTQDLSSQPQTKLRQAEP